MSTKRICCICGAEIEDRETCNPDPLVTAQDCELCERNEDCINGSEPVCCHNCDSMVTQSRIFLAVLTRNENEKTKKSHLEAWSSLPMEYRFDIIGRNFRDSADEAGEGVSE